MGSVVAAPRIRQVLPWWTGAHQWGAGSTRGEPASKGGREAAHVCKASTCQPSPQPGLATIPGPARSQLDGRVQDRGQHRASGAELPVPAGLAAEGRSLAATGTHTAGVSSGAAARIQGGAWLYASACAIGAEQPADRPLRRGHLVGPLLRTHKSCRACAPGSISHGRARAALEHAARGARVGAGSDERGCLPGCCWHCCRHCSQHEEGRKPSSSLGLHLCCLSSCPGARRSSGPWQKGAPTSVKPLLALPLVLM